MRKEIQMLDAGYLILDTIHLVPCGSRRAILHFVNKPAKRCFERPTSNVQRPTLNGRNRTAFDVAGFTLIELLVVLAIMAILMAFVVPAATNMMRGNSLSSAGQIITDRLSLARQTAVARNRTVEVRFYKYSDPQSPGSKNSYRALQAFEVDKANVFVPLEKVQTLPLGMIIDSGTSLSSLASLASSAVTSGTSSLPRVSSASYFTVRFLPNGSTDLLPTSDWFLTLHEENKGDPMTTPPPNFITVDVDPVGGTLRMFRPGT